MGGVVFALLAALCNAVSVIARHIASTANPDRPTGLRIVGYLLRNPGWLAGSAAQVGAFACQAVALHLGELSVVQPLLVVELVLALILRRLWIHQAIAGAFFETMQREVAEGRIETLGAHLPKLTYIALAPFTGADRAIELVEEMKARELNSGAGALESALADS